MGHAPIKRNHNRECQRSCPEDLSQITRPTTSGAAIKKRYVGVSKLTTSTLVSCTFDAKSVQVRSVAMGDRRRLLLGLLLVTLLLTLPAYSLVLSFLPTIKFLSFQGARVS